MRHTWIVEWASRQNAVQTITKSVLNFNRLILFISVIKMLIYKGQQERMISNAISEGNSFAFDSSCFEWIQWIECHSNGVLVGSSTDIFFIQSCCWRIEQKIFTHRFPQHFIWWKIQLKNSSWSCVTELEKVLYSEPVGKQEHQASNDNRAGWMTLFWSHFSRFKPENGVVLKMHPLFCFLFDKFLSVNKASLLKCNANLIFSAVAFGRQLYRWWLGCCSKRMICTVIIWDLKLELISLGELAH